MKIAKEMFACVIAIVAHASAYVVDRSSDVLPANHYDVTVSSGEAPTILDLLTRIDERLGSLEEGYENVNVEDESVEQQNNNLNKATKATIIRSARDVGCQEPSEGQLKVQLLQAKFFNGQMTQTHYDDQLADSRATFGSPYSGTCEIRSSSALGNLPLNKRSSCPWIYVEQEDKDRYPKKISYAKCECLNCIKGDGTQSFVNYCKPILEPRYVLKKGQCGANNIYQYDLSEEYVSVGCACSRASTS
ncbi:Interleukin 17-like protein [Holothuria leucospilota]|uniref:Interleukin 17-like protein n=1 Tax=Holothuria leucospilota TaxID=206669 RepID=A0A9Q1HGX6_HOLLE|nr:Interleukin 17-like protein [Holothuria leucospilota]